MKKIPLLFLLLPLITSAQITDSKFTVGASVGYTKPKGELAANNISELSSGYANFGFNSGANFTYRIKGFVGIAASIKSNSLVLYNPVNDNRTAKHENEKFTRITYDGNTPTWNTTGLCLGLYFPVPVAKWFTLDFKALGGIMAFTNSPYVTVEEIEGDLIINTQQIIFNKASFAVGNVYAGLRFNVAKHFAFTTSVDYLFGKPTFREFFLSNDYQRNTTSLNMTVGLLNYSLGFNYRFGYAKGRYKSSARRRR